jgi:hypothetical protein
MKKIIFWSIILCLAGPGYAQPSFSSLTTPISKDLLGISFADSSTGYACGVEGTIIKTTDGGANWSILSTGLTQKLWDIKVIPQSAGKKVIAVGDNNTAIKSMDGGLTWTPQSIPFLAGSFVFGIHCLDSLNYYACGGDYATITGAILVTTDGGITWSKTTVPGSRFLDKLFMLAPGKGFAAGTNASFDDGSVQKADLGPWAASKTTTAILTNIWCNSSKDIIAVGVGGQILKSDNGGSTWTNHAFNSTTLYGIGFSDPMNGFACGGIAPDNILLYTKNGGVNWFPVPFAFNGIFQSVSVAGGKVYIAGDQGRIIKANAPLSTGIREQSADEQLISVYPNPALDRICFSNPGQLSGLSFLLLDISGRVVKKDDIKGAAYSCTVQDLDAGMYSCRIFRDGVTIATKNIAVGK